jgi:hypothetical protein
VNFSEHFLLKQQFFIVSKDFSNLNQNLFANFIKNKNKKFRDSPLKNFLAFRPKIFPQKKISNFVPQL